MMQNMEHLPRQEYTQANERITPQRWSLLRWLMLAWQRFFYGAEQSEIHFEVERELEEGETVLWLGRPGIPKMTAGLVTGLILGITASLLILLACIGLVLGWGWNVLFPLFTGLYAGFWAWLATFLTRSKQHKLQRTRYMITDQRVAIITQGKKDRTVEGYYSIAQLQRTEKPDGTGNLTFVAPSAINTQQSNASLAGKFLNIADVREVETLLRRTFRQKREV
jgi:hypothetical protein